MGKKNWTRLFLSLWSLGLGLGGMNSRIAVADEGVGIGGGGVDPQLKAAALDAQKNLGPLEPWQKTLFDDEVVPQFQRFIQGQRATNQGLKTEIDLKSLKHYLLFYGPTILKPKDPRIVVFLKPDSGCPKCLESLPILTQLVQQRLNRRGLQSVWLSDEDVSQTASHLSLEERMTNVAKLKRSPGALTLQWAPAPVDDLDTAHADEQHFVIQAGLSFEGFSSQSRQKEVLENDSFQAVGSRLLTDLFTDLGAKIEAEQILIAGARGVAGQIQQEVLIEINGIKDFLQYTEVKALLQAQLKDIVSFEDRMFSKKSIVFSVYTNKNRDDIKRQMDHIKLDQRFTVGVQ